MSGELGEHEEPIDEDEVRIEPTTRTKAWIKIALISFGIFIVGAALLVVLWLLFTLTMGLIDEVL